MNHSTSSGCRPDFATITNLICSHSADNPFLSFSPALLQGQCVSPLVFQPPSVTSTSSQQTKATVEAVVYHISNESRLIVCIPETAMIHCLALARDQPLNNVYHCLPGLFNYPANIIDITARVPVLYDFKRAWVAIKKTCACKNNSKEIFVVSRFLSLSLTLFVMHK